MSLADRPYDRAMSPELLAITRRRRVTPDGVRVPVTTRRVEGGTVNVYPWDSMGVGDYFIVPLPPGVSFSGFRTRFKHVALRRDFEVSCQQWELGTHDDPQPGCRVTLSYHGSVRELKEKAGVDVSDGRWSEVRSARYANRKEKR